MAATKVRNIVYWASTAVTALALGATGCADLMRAPVIMESLRHLGYPTYFAAIIGVWEVLGAAAIVAPGLPRVKEWAYAGMFFTMSGAAVSHAVSGDPISKVLVAIVLLGVVVVSAASRPAARTLALTVFTLPRAA